MADEQVDFRALLAQDEVQEPAPPVTSVPDGPVDFNALLAQDEGQQKQEPFSTIFNKPSADISLGDVLGELIFGEQRQTTATETLPEFGGGQGLEIGQAAKVAGGLLSTMDPEAQKDIIRNAVPGAAFQEDEKGNTIVAIPQEDGGFSKSILNKPGISLADARTLTAQVMAFIPAARVASLGKSLLAKVGFGGAASGATDVALQKTAQGLGSEQPFDPLQTALATGLGGGAELATGILPTARNLARERKFRLDTEEFAEARPAVQEAQLATEELAQLSPTGEQVGLTQAQQTQVPSQLTQQRAIGEIPAGARTSKVILEKQNTQVSAAVDDVLNTISDPLAIERGPAKFRDASQKAIQAAEDIRAEKSSDIFETAFDTFDGKVPLKGTQNKILVIRRDAPEGGQLQKTMQKILGLLKGESKVVDGKTIIFPPSLRKLHNAKLEIDSMIAGEAGESLGRSVQRSLIEVQENLVNALKESSPKYKAASETFADLSPAVDALKESIVGTSARITTPQLKSLSKRIFDATETNPEVLRNAKKVISEVDTRAWDDLLRSEFQRRLGSIRSSKQGIPNTPGDLERAIFGTNDAQTRAIMEAASPTLRKNLRHLRTILKRAKEGRPGGSDTAAKQQARDERSINRLLGLFKPFQAVAEAGRGAAQLKRDQSIARALFDTKFITKLNRLEKLKIDSPAYVRALAQLLDEDTKLKDK